jgi:hypothetical protein
LRNENAGLGARIRCLAQSAHNARDRRPQYEGLAKTPTNENQRTNPAAAKPDTWDPEILCLTERLILDGKSADNASKEELFRAALELMSLAFVEWQRRCG